MRYSHHDHAGNYADVHKHWLLQLLLTRHIPGSGVFHYIESHAGSGVYRLNGKSGKRAHESGITRLWYARKLPPSVVRYLQLVDAVNPQQYLRDYPGSPVIAQQLLRPHDRALLFENQPDVYRELTGNLCDDTRIEIRLKDGYQGVASVSLTDSTHLLLLLDPPYRDRDDFRQVPRLLRSVSPLTGNRVAAVWYPLFDDGCHQYMKQVMGEQYGPALWACEFERRSKSNGTMAGSGMLLLNPDTEVISEAERDAQDLAALMDCEARYWRPS